MNSQRALPPAQPGASGWPWAAAPVMLPAAMPNGAPWPLITVVTPSYNQGRFLEAALRSVLLQGYPNLEYIVMDGGSSDESVNILRRYAPWLSHWTSQPDGGQSRALNLGFSRASGAILGWLNSDDLLLPGALAHIARAFHQYPDAILIYGDAQQIDADGSLRASKPDARPYDRAWLLAEHNLVPQPSAYFRAEAFRAAGGFDESLYYAMDWDLWLRLGALGPAIFIPEPLSQMRIHAEAKTGIGGRPMFTEVRRVVEQHGGAGLPSGLKRKLVAQHLPLAWAALLAGNPDEARSEMAYALSHAPVGAHAADAWLAEAIAAGAWRLFLKEGVAPFLLAQRAAAALPADIRDPAFVLRRSVGLLHHAQAMQAYQAGQHGLARQAAWKALRADRLQRRNRGLWALWLRAAWAGLRSGRGAPQAND